jgi:hypothetical protein
MARSISDIQQSITTIYVAQMAGAGITVDPTTWSSVNLQRLFIYAVAAATFVLETLFDTFQGDVNTTIQTLKPHSARWYASMALAYQYGFALTPDTDTYDNTGYTDDQITASKVVQYAAVIEQTDQFGRVFLRIKLAGSDGTDLQPLTADQLTGVTAYLQEIKDAGVRLQIDSLPPDGIMQQWVIYYDPLVLNASGARLDGQDSTPVQDAITGYLTQLPFSGTLVLQYQMEAVKSVSGVVICKVTGCQTQYGNLPYTNVDVMYTPDAGYLRFGSASNLTIQFIPQAPLQ